MTFSPCIIQLDLISQAYYLLDPECRPLNFQRGFPIFLPLLHTVTQPLSLDKLLVFPGRFRSDGPSCCPKV